MKSKNVFETNILSRIPEHEKELYQVMKQLDQSNKRLLWQLIKNSNKENVNIYKGSQEELSTLLNKRLISYNSVYIPEKMKLVYLF